MFLTVFFFLENSARPLTVTDVLLASLHNHTNESSLIVACEAQTYFRSSLLSLRRVKSRDDYVINPSEVVNLGQGPGLFGGREATTGNTSALRRLL